MKKTYSRYNNDLSGLVDKNSTKTDPFDELLSSPLKQDIQFQPLSLFWSKKEKEVKSKKKSRKPKYGLFETSESEESDSPGKSFATKENVNAESFDSPPLEQNVEFQSQNLRKTDFKSKNKFKDKCEIEKLGSSESDDVFSPCHQNSFLSGLRNVTIRRGFSNNSYNISNDKVNVTFEGVNGKTENDSQVEINHSPEELNSKNVTNDSYNENLDGSCEEKVDLDVKAEVTQILNPQEIISPNVTTRKSSTNNSCTGSSEYFTTSSEETEEEANMVTQLEIDQTILPQMTERNSLRNITKRRGLSNQSCNKNLNISSKKTEEKDNLNTEIDQTLELSLMTERLSLDSNKTICFARPLLESTRVQDLSPIPKSLTPKRFNDSPDSLEKTKCNVGYALKPGKEWFRSMSVLKQIQNGSMMEGGFKNSRFTDRQLESTRITGRKFESFVQDLLEMQNSTLCEYQMDNFIENESDISLDVSQNCSVLSKSIPDKSVMEKSLLNYTVKVVQSEDKPSAFKSALGLEVNYSIQDYEADSIQNKSSTISARDFILMQCGQTDVLPFEKYFNERTLRNCKKIGEGVYGEVFMTDDAVIKIIPIEGSDKVNGEPQKTFEEIISEVVIATKLSNLRKGEKHRTNGFSEVRRCWCVKGKYPKHLLKLWNEYDQAGSGSENDSPVMFKNDQLYIILELGNGGKDLESFVFSSSAQSLSIFIQASFSLAVAEKAFEFEHRDLHWGNVLISPTKEEFVSVVLDGIEYKIPSKGVKVCIIDFTLSRISHEGCCIFNDLSVDPSLFVSEGDYQFEIYRMMLKEVKNDWSLFRPKTNIYWLHYMLDKMIKMVRYKNKKAKLHTKHLKDLQTLESVVLNHSDCGDFVLSDTLFRIMKKS